MRIGLVTSGYPPDLDGIGDYTWWMARTLAEQHDVHVFTRNGGSHLPSSGVNVVPFYDSTKSASFAFLTSHVETWPRQHEEAHWLVLQYNPFCWGKRGFCPWVPRTLRRIKQLPNAPRVAVMLHETYVPNWPLKCAIMSLWQKPIFRDVCRIADAIFVSTSRWLPQVERVSGTAKAQVLPVGSNIPRSSLSQAEARSKFNIPRDAIVLGAFGSAHPSRLVDWIGAAARAVHGENPRALLLYIGKDAAALRPHCRQVPFIDLGLLPYADAADGIRAMDIMLCPFIDGISTRRCSALAGLENDVPIVSTHREWTDKVFTEYVGPLISLTEVCAGSNLYTQKVTNLVSQMSTTHFIADSNRDWYVNIFGWRHLAGRLLSGLAS